MNFLSLPPELHQIIFDYAAYSPDKLSSPAIYNTPKRDKQATLLPLICKQLCPIAQTIIWRHLSISDLTVSSSDLDGLFVSLTQHEPRVFDDVFIIPPPAQCVQSLYLSHFFRRSHGAQVASLIQLCPQLINLHIVDASYNLTPVLERAFLAKGDKLQRFYLQIDAHFERRIIRSQPVGIERTLQLLPNLRSLSVQATSELQLSMCSTPWTSLRHLDIDSYALAPETIESILQSNADTIDEISIDNESIKSYQPYQTLMESSDATAFHFMGPPDDDQMLQRTLSNFGRLYSLTLVGTLSFDWLGSAPFPPTMRQLTLQRLHISPFPVIGTLITNEEAIPSVDFLWVTFDANNVFFDRGKNQWGLPLPRDFFLPAFEELESAAKFIDDGFSGSSLAVGHSTLRNYAKNRGLERKPRPMLVQQFGFTK